MYIGANVAFNPRMVKLEIYIRRTSHYPFIHWSNVRTTSTAKAVTALRGQSIKDYVLDQVLPDTLAADKDEALRQLEAFPEPRYDLSKGTAISKSVEQKFEGTHQ